MGWILATKSAGLKQWNSGDNGNRVPASLVCSALTPASASCRDLHWATLMPLSSGTGCSSVHSFQGSGTGSPWRVGGVGLEHCPVYSQRFFVYNFSVLCHPSNMSIWWVKRPYFIFKFFWGLTGIKLNTPRLPDRHASLSYRWLLKDHVLKGMWNEQFKNWNWENNSTCNK